MIMNKVWCFNCFGVCIAYICESDIEKYNETHLLFNEKIVSWK